HDERGAMGIVINRETDVSLGEVFSQLGFEWPDDNRITDRRVFLGGPVDNERGFIIHSPVGEWDSSFKVTDDLAVTTSKDMLLAMSENHMPDRVLVALGYAGWGAGQLENEMMANAWMSGPADLDIIFDLPVDERWQAAATHLGVDLSRLSNDIGHA
ncbi:MAG: YqgE/AlgH family protein, partial [Gammaproteobacteria bacterium]|nr:YqgE/AlgH family protein [Gammaproteobacteria bacterium]